MKSSNEKGSEAEKYARKFMESRGYISDIHPRTSFFNGKFYMSRENDFFNAFDIMAYSWADAALVQVTDTSSNADSKNIKIDGGNVAFRRDKIDSNFPLTAPYLHILVFLTQKRWVQRPGEHRHKEYFHRAWERAITDHGFVWVEREAWSNLPNATKVAALGKEE